MAVETLSRTEPQMSLDRLLAAARRTMEEVPYC
jgi:hypothetical protein